MTQEQPTKDQGGQTENTEPPAAESLDNLEMPRIDTLADGITPDKLAKEETAGRESSFSGASLWSLVRNLDPRYLHFLVVTPNEHLNEKQLLLKTVALLGLLASVVDINPEVILGPLGLGDDTAYSLIVSKCIIDLTTRWIHNHNANEHGEVSGKIKALITLIKLPGFPGWLAERIFNILPRHNEEFKDRGEKK